MSLIKTLFNKKGSDQSMALSFIEFCFLCRLTKIQENWN